MSQTDFTKFFDPSFTKNLAAFSGFPFDINAIVDVQRKNFEAISAANKQAFEGLQAVAQRQSELLSQMAQDNSAVAQELLNTGTPEQKVAKQAELLQKNYEKSVANLQEISELLNKSNKGATDIINKRISASLTEVKAAIEKGAKKPAQKAA